MAATLGKPLDKLPELPPLQGDDLVNDYFSKFMDDPNMINSDDVKLTDEQWIKLYSMFTPYGHMACDPPKDESIEQSAFISHVNIRDTFNKRLNMTGLVGFMYQMLHEFQVEEDVRSWFPKEPEYRTQFTLERLKSIASVIGMKVVQAEQAQAAYEKQVQVHLLLDEAREKLEAKKARGEEWTDDDKAQWVEVEKKPAKDVCDKNERALQMDVQYAIYDATNYIGLAGLDAQLRDKETRENTMKFEELRSRVVDAGFKAQQHPSRLTVPDGLAKKIVRNFLDTYLRFDVAEHVRAAASSKSTKKNTGYKEALTKAVSSYYEDNVVDGVDQVDPHHFTLEQINLMKERPPATEAQLLDDINYISTDKYRYNTALYLARGVEFTEVAQRILGDREKYLRYLAPQINKLLNVGGKLDGGDVPTMCIPPQDTFHRYSYYMQVNYNALKEVTQAIYPERDYLDSAIAIWKTVKGSPEENRKQFDTHCDKYQQNTPCPILEVPFYKWVVISDHEDNRKNIRIYNRDTLTLQRILDRHAEDQKMGSELMKNRIRKNLAKNVQESGPHADKLKDYKAQYNTTTGASVSLTDEEKLRIRKAQGDLKAAEELKYLDELEDYVKKCDERMAKGEKLDPFENTRYETAKRQIPEIRSELSIPERSVKVNVFINDGGNMRKEEMYTAEDTI